MSITKKIFGKLENGDEVFSFTLRNKTNVSVTVINYGATITNLFAPDRNGNLADIAGGYDDLESYVNAPGYQGAIVGRFANRIAKGQFTLNGESYNLTINNGKNHLHGGKYGFDKKVWDCEEIDGNEPSLIMRYTSPDGEEGYPGTLNVCVKYTLRCDNALSISYTATCDKATPVNLTNHCFFNIGGYDSGKIYDHILKIDASTYLPTNNELIPTGELKPVDNTAFDFRSGKEISKGLFCDDEDIKATNGFDHCLNFEGGETKDAVKRVELYDPKSGRAMELYTNQPSLQFYSGNYLTNSKFPFKNGCVQSPHTLMCLETQKMPDSVNHDNFTNVILNPGEEYYHIMTLKFSTK